MQAGQQAQILWRYLKKSAKAAYSRVSNTAAVSTDSFSLCFHRVVDDIRPHPFTWDMTISASRLRAIIRSLKKRGYHFKYLGQSPSIEKNAVYLTFDDGYLDQFSTLGPLLKEEGVCATVFIAPGLIDQPESAWWYML